LDPRLFLLSPLGILAKAHSRKPRRTKSLHADIYFPIQFKQCLLVVERQSTSTYYRLLVISLLPFYFS